MEMGEPTWILAASAGVLLLVVVGGILLRFSRSSIRLRCLRLEETVRTYNNANMTIGRHVGALEAELRELRQRLAAMETTQKQPETHLPRQGGAPDDAGDDAETRLLRLIRSRLDAPRAVV